MYSPSSVILQLGAVLSTYASTSHSVVSPLLSLIVIVPFPSPCSFFGVVLLNVFENTDCKHPLDLSLHPIVIVLF